MWNFSMVIFSSSPNIPVNFVKFCCVFSKFASGQDQRGVCDIASFFFCVDCQCKVKPLIRSMPEIYHKLTLNSGHKLGCANAGVFTQIPHISYHKCGIFPHHFLASVGTTSVWCNSILVYLDIKSTAELSLDCIWYRIIPNKRVRRGSIVIGL